jgi:hypothetical protein
LHQLLPQLFLFAVLLWVHLLVQLTPLLLLLLLLLLPSSPEWAGSAQVRVYGRRAHANQACQYCWQSQLLHCRPAMAAAESKVVVVSMVCGSA